MQTQMIKMNKTVKQKIVITIIAATSAIFFGGITQAAYDSSLTGKNCALSIHPFKMGGTTVSDTENQWFNIFSSSGICTQHLTYPNQYSPQPPTLNDNPFKNVNGVENIFAPVTRHGHKYTNASKEDDSWYKSYMAKFQVTLSNDSLSKTENTQIVCGTSIGPRQYVETPGCNGTIDEWGTTTISFNQNTGVITWDFAESSAKTGRPMLWGNNSSLNTPAGYFDVYVKLVSKNNPEEIWSATTTSRALIRDLALFKNDQNNADKPSCTNDGVIGATKDFNGKWCTLDPPNLSGVENAEINDGKQYYWFQIGSVATVWRKPAAPPLNVCEDLKLTKPPVALTATQIQNLTGRSNIPQMHELTLNTLRFTNTVDGNIRWTSTDPSGQFWIESSPGQLTPTTTPRDWAPPANATANLNKIWYSGAGLVTATVSGIPENQIGAACNDDVIIPPIVVTPVCSKILVDSRPLTATIGTPVPLPPAASIDTTGAPYNANIIYSITAGQGSLTHLPLFVNQQQITVSPNNEIPVLFTSTQAGPTTISISTEGTNAAGCSTTMIVTTKAPPVLECTGLTSNISELKENSIHEILGTASYSRAHTNTITYTVNGQYGAFVDLSPSSPATNLIMVAAIRNAQNQNAINNKGQLDQILSQLSQPQSTTTTRKPENQNITLVTFGSNLPAGTYNDILRIQATGFDNNDCNITIPLVKERKPDTPVCQSLEVTPVDIWRTRDSQQEFRITNVTPPGIAANLKYTWKVVSDPGTWENSGGLKEISVEGPVNQTVTGSNRDSSIEVFVEGTRCRDTASPSGGGGGGGNGFRPTPPEIEKYVFPETTPQIYNQLPKRINISKDTEFIAYMIVFKPGNNITIATIEDIPLKSDRILAKDIPGVPRGHMQLIGPPTIEVTENLEAYFNNRGNSSFTISVCGTTTPPNTPCYNRDNFADEGIITLENIDDNIEAFIIKYKMENKTIIDETMCKSLTKAQGCGEEFNNKVIFSAKPVLADKVSTYSGEASTKTIAICPFILTRAGGDVFFHDVVNTGIDVAQCSEVKSSTGPGIKPTPTIPLTTGNTGQGDTEDPELVLTAPSHDICRFSNQDNNVEGYNDVLKHFSSTICELQADVAEVWQEQYINKAINANITRISRWGANLSGVAKTIGSMDDLVNISNLSSGVFVKEGGTLTIGSVDSEFTIGPKNGIPAAQTYIIKNGDLKILSDIKYSGGTTFSDPRTIPSAAFIVIDGNICIHESVEQIDGILMAVNLTNPTTSDDGKIEPCDENKPGFTDDISDTRLTINGSLIGNVYNLFANRIGVGDPTKDEGSVTIRYDQRILLNTPPGISELIDIEQAIVPN